MIAKGYLKRTDKNVCNMCLEYAEDHFVVSTKPTSGQPSAGPSTQHDPSLPSVQEQMDIDAPNNPGPSTSTIQPEPGSAHAPAQMESSISSNNTMNPGPSLIHPAPVLSPAPAQMESSTSTDYLVVQMTDITRQIKELTWQTLNEEIRSGLVNLCGALGELIKDDVSKDGRENILSAPPAAEIKTFMTFTMTHTSVLPLW